ncbi:aspartate--tRNA(Asn) ligase [Candidatus Woesearchaeota archaeon]|nr:aspartate--tRNA(Asn) ligase [Candidatus Woesearchaeota archaeon]
MTLNRIYIKDLSQDMDNKDVVIAGWAQEIRDLKKIKFILLRDRTDSVQCVAMPKEMDNKSFEDISNVTKESVLEIQGVLKKSEQAKKGFEIVVKKMILLSRAEPLPIDISGKIETGLDKRLDFRWLDTRRPKINAIFKVRSEIFAASVDFFHKNGFVNINTSKMTAIGVESGAELFEIKYFAKKLFLAQSPQVYKEMFVGGGFEKVYEIAPVFRAEKHHTNRHLCEFTGIDFEMGFIKDENDVMDVIEDLIIHILKWIKEKCKKELAMFKQKTEIPEKIPRVPMELCKKYLAEKGKELPEDEDFDSEAEKIMGSIAREKFGTDFIFVTRYPFKVRPFYHMKPEDDANSTKSFDLLWKGMEICTGAQREHRHDVLKSQAKQKGIDFDKMPDYANIFKWGMPPHGGVGFGLDRIVLLFLGLNNVREAVLLPRDPERIKP